MSQQAAWYRNKAAECGRLAAMATDDATRSRHLRDQKNWDKIAEGIETAEAALKLLPD
jgi:hypothetical protein